MIKNLGKITQWAGEKLGSSHGTLPSDEFKDFQTETKKRHDDFEGLRHTMELTIQHIHKNKITSDNGRKRSPMGAYGESLVAHAGMFPRDSLHWNLLTSFGLGERRISEAEDRFADHIKDNYVGILQQSGVSFKEYLTLCRKLESRRLDYDAKYNRLQKAKKESPDSEQSVQSAKVKYEETEVDVIQCMISLQDTETEHCDALRSLLEAQLSYHKEAVKILEGVKNGWDQWENQNSMKPVSVALPSNNTIDDDGNIKVKGGNEIQPRQQRALYDHIQDHDDELTFHVNDIITVLHEVDEAWWFGEILDINGNTSRGIFPVNYTEPFTTRKPSNSSSISKEEADIAKLKYDIDQGKVSGPGDGNNNKQRGNTTTTTTATSSSSSVPSPSSPPPLSTDTSDKQKSTTTTAPSSGLPPTTFPQASSPLPNIASPSSLGSMPPKAPTTIAVASSTTSKKCSSAQQPPPPPPPHSSSTIMPKTTPVPPAATAPMKPPSQQPSNPDPVQNTSPTPTPTSKK